MKKFIALFLTLMLLLTTIAVAVAQEDDSVEAEGNGLAVEIDESLEELDESLSEEDSTELEEVEAELGRTEARTRRSIGQWFSDALTFDKRKKAEHKLKFAEERLNAAVEAGEAGNSERAAQLIANFNLSSAFFLLSKVSASE